MNRRTNRASSGGPGSARASPAPRSSSGTGPSSSSNGNTASGALSTLYSSYMDKTPARLKLIDAFCVFLMVLGVLQFVYCVLVTNFPFNSFIAGFGATVGQFVLAASLRIQANRANNAEFKNYSPERAFADFVFGSLVLHFFVFNFLG